MVVICPYGSETSPVYRWACPCGAVTDGFTSADDAQRDATTHTTCNTTARRDFSQEISDEWWAFPGRLRM